MVGGGRSLMVDGIATCETQGVITTGFRAQRFDLKAALFQWFKFDFSTLRLRSRDSRGLTSCSIPRVTTLPNQAAESFIRDTAEVA